MKVIEFEGRKFIFSGVQRGRKTPSVRVEMDSPLCRKVVSNSVRYPINARRRVTVQSIH